MTRVLRGGALVLIALGACSTGDPADEPASTAMNQDVIKLNADSISQYNLSAGPNGQIVYTRVVDGRANVFVADSNGGNPRRLSSGVWDAGPRWSSDGKWIAFDREVNGVDVIAISVDSGVERVLTSTSAFETLVGWLPDNSGVVYRKFGARNELWTATLDGKTARLVDADANVKGMISPDGQLVVYEVLDKGQRTLWLLNLATKATRQLTTDGYESFPDGAGAWSPDSRRVLYLSRRSGTADVWSIDVSTGATTQLTQDVRDDLSPQFSPDGHFVAFLSSRGGQVDAWVVADTGGEATRISDDRALESAIEWTRDGTSLLISAEDGRSQAYLAALDGSAPRRLVNENTEESEVNLSADGLRIVYTSSDGPDLDVRTSLVAGGPSTLVAGGPADDRSPNLSPDGKRVVFVSTRAGNPNLYVAPIEGGDAVQVLDWESSESNPSWSPDGQQIAFFSSKESLNDIWLVKPDGSGARRLTNDGPSSDARLLIEWSHDGRLIAYATPAGEGTDGVHVVDVSTGEARVIARCPCFDGRFWPGDSLITVSRADAGMLRLELRRVADGSLVRMLSVAEGPAYELIGEPSPDSRYVALSQFTFQNNDYRPAVRSLADTTTRVLLNLRGVTTGMWWMPDSKAVVFTAATEQQLMYRRRFVAPK